VDVESESVRLESMCARGRVAEDERRDVALEKVVKCRLAVDPPIEGVSDGLSITLVYHRLLAHRSFRVPKWLEHV